MASVDVIPGMTDFFGKKLGSMVLGAMSHLSPVALHQGDLGRRITAAAAEGDIPAAHEIFRGILEGIKGRGDYKLSDWFQGKNIGEAAESLTDSLKKRRMAMRLGVPSVLGAAAITSFVGQDSVIDHISTGAMGIGFHTATAGMLGRGRPLLGAGYAGIIAGKMLMPGDGIGPY